MTKLECILYKFDGYVVVSGVATIATLAEISRQPTSYQEDINEEDQTNIVRYLLASGSYLPEITLAGKVSDYDGLLIEKNNTGVSDSGVSSNDDGMEISGEKFITKKNQYKILYRCLEIEPSKNKLFRIDGNRRLGIFDNEGCIDKILEKLIETRELKEGAESAKRKIKNKVVPFAVILSKAPAEQQVSHFEMKLFHDINFRAMTRKETYLAKLSTLKNLDDFDDNYKLAIDLIKEVEKGSFFNAIHWLKVDADKSYYRTVCFLIAKLLIERKTFHSNEFKELKSKLNGKLKPKENNESEQMEQVLENSSKFENLEKEFEKLQRQKQKLNQKWNNLEKLKHDARKRLEQGNLYSEKLKKLENDRNELEKQKNELEAKENKLMRLNQLNNFTKKCEDKQQILLAIGSLIDIYLNFNDKEYGNIAFLCAAVYYSLLDKNLLKLFVIWAVQNGINKITAPDLSEDASLNLITMFNQIHQAKKNDIFISMQFGDSQSELIYEKVCRSIDKFNEKHKSIYLRLRPIRIDRVIGVSESIQENIKKAIQSSGLIIADLSSANINVYQEIGYAMGLAESHNMAPNIILLYKENTEHNKDNKDIDKFVGFNLRNLSQLRFSNYDQLVNGLVERLEKYYEVGC